MKNIIGMSIIILLMLGVLSCGYDSTPTEAKPDYPDSSGFLNAILDDDEGSTDDENIIPLYTETYANSTINFDIYTWGDSPYTCKISDINDSSGTIPDGTKYMKVVQNGTTAWLGLGFTPIDSGGSTTIADFTKWSNATLHIYVRSTNGGPSDMEAGMIVGSTEYWLNFTSYSSFTADNTWYHLEIPYSDFGFTAIESAYQEHYLAIRISSVTTGEFFYLDNIYWERPE